MHWVDSNHERTIMKTFLQIALDNKAHKLNREAMFNSLREDENVNVDNGIKDGVSNFTIEVWSKDSTEVVGIFAVAFEDGKKIDEPQTKNYNQMVQELKLVLAKAKMQPDHDISIGIENLVWGDRDIPVNGYAYHDHVSSEGNMGVYITPENLEKIIKYMIEYK